MYNNPYINQQQTIDRINAQMADLERIRNQLQQPIPSINQTFQLAPNKEVMRYANSLQEVQKDAVIGDTPYFSKDMSVVWIKNTKGDIKTYELNEIIPKDDKDLMISNLQLQIAELRKEIKNAKSNDDVIDEPIENEKSTDVSNNRKNAKK